MNSNTENPFSLEGKKIIITGASSGIGRQCAFRCSSLGATLFISGRDETRLQETYGLLKQGDHEKFIGDLSDFTMVENFADKILDKYGKVDGLLSCIGYELTLPAYMTKPKDYQALFNTNVISGFELCRQMIRKNGLREKSSLVFISSVMGMVGQVGKVGYCSSKGALISGTKALALELATKAIRANVILPAVCKTPLIEKMFSRYPEEKIDEIIKMHPLGLGSPDDVALAAVYLLSDASKWVTGACLTVDGGYSAQ